MADTIISEEVKNVINAPDTVKVLATTDPQGVPHAVFKQSLHVNEDGNLEYYEIMETSQTNKNVTYGIWFDKQVSINVLAGDRRSFQIKGIPKKAIIAGAYFEKVYRELGEKRQDSDLSTIWIIEPRQIVEETFQKRLQEEEEKHPHILHLDRIAKE